MSNEPNKPIPAQELSEEELGGIVGGATVAWSLGYSPQDSASGTSLSASGISLNDKFSTYCITGDAAAVTGFNGLMTLR